MNQPFSIPGVTASSTDGELLWYFWYPALRSDEIARAGGGTRERIQVIELGERFHEN